MAAGAGEQPGSRNSGGRTGLEQRRRPRHLHRLAVRAAHGVHLTGKAIHDQFGGLVVAVGAVLAEVADGEHADLGVGLTEELPAAAQPLQRAGGEVLHHQIGPGSKAGQPGAAIFGAQV